MDPIPPDDADEHARQLQVAIALAVVVRVATHLPASPEREALKAAADLLQKAAFPD